MQQRKDRIAMNGEKNVYLHKKEDLEIKAKEGEKKRKGKQREVYGKSVTCKQGVHKHQQDPNFPPLTWQYAGNTLRWRLTIEGIEGNNLHHSHPTKRKERQQYDIMKETPTLVFHVKQQNA